MSAHSKKRFFWGIIIVITAFICGLLDYSTSSALPYSRNTLIIETISTATTANDLKAMQTRLKENGLTMEILQVTYNDHNTVKSISVTVKSTAGNVSYTAKNMSATGHFDIMCNYKENTLKIGQLVEKTADIK